MELGKINKLNNDLRANIGKSIIGQKDAIDLFMVSLLAEGHLLLEGMPGVAKTLLAQTFSASLNLKFNRIQFTPDLMPGDVLGTNIFNFKTSKFTLTKGPIFTEILLADEINRTPPKTQAALLQAMQERVVTIDGKAHGLSRGFMVIATQNPSEQHGTYPLPEAQLDRFLFKHVLNYPSKEEETEIVQRHSRGTVMPDLKALGVKTVANLKNLEDIRKTISGIRLAEEIVEYGVNIVRATREHPSLKTGASPRAASMLCHAARCLAPLEGRDYVIPDDIKVLTQPALRHRISLAPSAEIDNISEDEILEQILGSVKAPK